LLIDFHSEICNIPGAIFSIDATFHANDNGDTLVEPTWQAGPPARTRPVWRPRI
jgi:hypothetical protein